MPLLVNLRHLVDRDLALQGEIPAAELDLETRDELIRVTSPLTYKIEVQRLEESLLARGRVRLELDCQCVRCLKPFKYQLEIPDWVCDVPLAGEEKVPVVNDCVDLTPYLREDTLLTFPQHPLCEPECGGLKPQPARTGPGEPETGPSPWSELDKLKL
jgi:uncharacterized protein